MNFKRIVAAVDFSDTSQKALQTALNLAMENQSQLYLFHVVEPYLTDDPSVMHPAVEISEKAARERLESLIPEEARDWAKVEIHVVTDTGPGRAVSDFAREQKADLIVVGTHGRKGLSRVLMGSTAETLLRRSPCQVLVVKPKAAAPAA